MLSSVVTAGTGRRAKLDYTHVAGKTGTSTAYRDAWFMGYTGQYVTGVWLGNDDFRPMARVTGGSFPAQTWQTYMMAAHDTDNIPTIPGVDPHPRQLAEQQRIAAVMSQSATADLPVPPPPENVKDMPQATRDVLNRLGTLLERAPALSPQDQASQDRVEATPAAPAPSLASAANGDGSSSTPAVTQNSAAAQPADPGGPQ